jgi:3-hydroxybutyryl-CoA dehydrogenase
MNSDEIQRIAVIGAGTMGSGTAELFAEAGFDVIWYNRSAAGLERGLARVRANQQVLLDAGVLTPAQAGAALARLQPTTELHALAGADLVGLDLAHAINSYVFPTLSNTQGPSKELQELVAAASWARKPAWVSLPIPATRPGASSTTIMTRRSNCCKSKRSHEITTCLGRFCA